MKKGIQTVGMNCFIRIVTVCFVLVTLLSILSCQVQDEALNDLQESVSNEAQLKNATVTSADIDGLILLINNMVTAGELESGIANSLLSKLDNAKKSLENGNGKAAMNLFYAVENQLKDLIYTGKISVATGDILTSVINTFTGEWSCGQPLVDLRDGNVYKTLKIGDQCWMAENLAYLPAVSPSSLGSSTDPYYYVYDYPKSDVTVAKLDINYLTFGVLYNWPAANISSPAGWHLPSDVEWTRLVTFLIANGYNYDETTTGNKIAKSMAATTNWVSSTILGAIGNDLSLNNTSGFTALPGGHRNINGTFIGLGFGGRFWSSTEFDSSKAWHRYLFKDNAYEIHTNNFEKVNGFSVRCIKD